MRALTLILLLLIGSAAMAQRSEVVQQTGSKEELYNRAHNYVVMTFNSANHVLQMNDKDAGKLIAKGKMEVYGSVALLGWVDYTLSIQVKDGRYKYEFNQLYFHGNDVTSGVIGDGVEKPKGLMSLTKGQWKKAIAAMNAKIDLMEAALLASMLEETQDDDW